MSSRLHCKFVTSHKLFHHDKMNLYWNEDIVKDENRSKYHEYFDDIDTARLSAKKLADESEIKVIVCVYCNDSFFMIS